MHQGHLTARGCAGRADFARIAALMNECEAVDQLEWGITPEELEGELVAPHIDLARDLRLLEDQQGRLIGYSDMQMQEAEGHLTGTFFLLVAPDLRGQGLEQELLGWALERLRQAAAERGLAPLLKAFARDDDRWRVGLFETLGASARYLWRMRCDLFQPPPEQATPPGYRIRPLRDDEIAAWAEAYNDSFIDAWDHHPQSEQDARHFLRADPYYRRDLDLVAEGVDGALAGFCLSTINPAENERSGRLEGGVRLLGTRRGQRGRGLGRALLLAALRLIRQEGMQSAWLGVDAASPTGATRLYESVGFRVVETYLTWLVEI